MTDTMPDKLYAGRVRNDKLICFEADDSAEAKYHHDRVVQALLSDNERLRELLAECEATLEKLDDRIRSDNTDAYNWTFSESLELCDDTKLIGATLITIEAALKARGE